MRLHEVNLGPSVALGGGSGLVDGLIDTGLVDGLVDDSVVDELVERRDHGPELGRVRKNTLVRRAGVHRGRRRVLDGAARHGRRRPVVFRHGLGRLRGWDGRSRGRRCREVGCGLLSGVGQAGVGGQARGPPADVADQELGTWPPVLDLDTGEPRGELRRGRRSAALVLRHRVQQQVRQRRRRLAVHQRLHRVAQDPEDDRGGRLPLVGTERGATGDQLVERGRELVDVGGRGRRAALEQLRRRVQRREVEQPGRRLGRGLQHRDAEVGERGFPELGDQDVLRLDVAVQDLGPVGGLQRAGDLDAERHDLGDREPGVGGHAVGDGAVAQLEYEHRSLIGRPERAVQRDDVGMRADCSERDRLAFEGLQGPRRGVPDVEQLEGHQAVRADLTGAEDGGQAAHADLGDVGEPGEELVLRGGLGPTHQRHVNLPTEPLRRGYQRKVELDGSSEAPARTA